MNQPPAKLDDFGDFLTKRDVCKLLGRGPRYLDRLITLERRTGIRCTPEPAPNFGLGRQKQTRYYPKENVRKWMRSGGVPEVALKSLEAA